MPIRDEVAVKEKLWDERFQFRPLGRTKGTLRVPLEEAVHPVV